MGQDCCSNREPTDKNKDGEALDLIRNKNSGNPNEPKNTEATTEKVK